jgi:hypothetical protein
VGAPPDIHVEVIASPTTNQLYASTARRYLLYGRALRPTRRVDPPGGPADGCIDRQELGAMIAGAGQRAAWGAAIGGCYRRDTRDPVCRRCSIRRYPRRTMTEPMIDPVQLDVCTNP